MAFDFIMCGFELASTGEYSGATSLTVENTYKGYSPYYAKILANGNVYWTLSGWTGNSQVATYLSCNVRLPLSTHIKPIKLSNSAGELSVAIDDSGVATRTFTIKAAGNTYTTTCKIPANTWANIVICFGLHRYYATPSYLSVYVNSIMIYSDAIAAHGLNDATITELRSEAFSGANSSVLYIDDVHRGYGPYPYTLGVIQPLIPSYNKSSTVLAYPVGRSRCTLINEATPDDDSTYLYTNSTDMEEGYFTAPLSSATPSGKLLYSVSALSTLARIRCTVARTTEKYWVCARIGNTTAEWMHTPEAAVTTSYVDYLDYMGNTWDVTAYLYPNTAAGAQIGFGVAGTVNSQTRCTKYRAQALCQYTNKPSRFGMTSDVIGTGGWDISFDVDAATLANGDYIMLQTNVKGFAIGDTKPTTSSYTGIKIYISTDNEVWAIVGPMEDSAATDVDNTEYAYIATDTSKLKLRIVMHDAYISIFESDRWIYTFTLVNVSYPSTLTLSIKSNVAVELTNVVCAELSDWREATYIDTQSSMSSGVSSVIQERPVEITPVQGGKVDFSYNRTRTNINAVNILKHDISELNNQNAGSHYIVYYRDISTVVDEYFMDSNGYITRVLQMSNLDSGATDMAKIVAQRMRENQEHHSLECSPDIRIEPGDKVTISYTLSATERIVSTAMIAESISINLGEGNYSMSVEGRKFV